MGNDTKVTTVVLGGSLAAVLIGLLGPLLARWRGEPLPPGFEAALGTVITAALAWLTPPDMLAKLRRRTRSTKP